MYRPEVHAIPRAVLAARLRATGLRVEEMHPPAHFDLLVNGHLRVAVRAAVSTMFTRRVRFRERRYRYVYRAWSFNFHRRGRLEERYCDVFVCVPLTDGAPDFANAYVIPWAARTGKTFYLPDSEHGYRGKYAPYRGDWKQLQRRGPRTAATTTGAPRRVRAIGVRRGAATAAPVAATPS